MDTCTNCGGNNLQWHCGTENTGGAVDGRLRMHEIKPVFFLGCEDCNETLSILDGDQVANILNGEHK